MAKQRIWVCFLVLGLSHLVLSQSGEDLSKPEEEDESNSPNETKKGKVFSLFSVVQFKNSPCSASNPVLNGTCYTASECANKGGMSGGNCASGFGVCCVFKLTKAGTVNQNSTYIQNPGFPAAYTSTAGIAYTVNKVSSDICSLRLDFNTFVIVGPQTGTTTVTIAPEIGSLCPDSFTVTVATGQTIPKICGINTGQHIYVDIGSGSSDTATLAFAFSSTVTSSNRQWDIKVSQIPCTSVTNPPNGCLQYYYSPSGRITTFNFADTIGGHLDNQQYSICLRPESGYCCVQYSVCADQTNAFSLSSGDMASAIALKSVVDSPCNTLDYIQISGSSSSCTVQGNNLFSRYCGSVLSTDTISTMQSNVPICDCTPPFEVGIFTNGLGDKQVIATIAIANDAFSRGTCLDFVQIPC